MNKTFIIAIIIFLFGVYSYAIYELGKSNAKTRIQTQTIENYIEVKDTLLVPKFITKHITKTDTLKVADSIYIWKDVQYIAQIDTVLKDSLLSGSIQFVSPVKLHPASYFNLDLKVKEKIIKEVQECEISFWDNRFIPVFGIGGVYTQDGKADLGLFLGFGVRLN